MPKPEPLPVRTPTGRRRARTPVLAAVAAVALALGLTGCGVEGGASAASVDAVAAPPLLTVVDWAVVADNRVAVLVRNPHAQTLLGAQATLVGLGADGQELGRWTIGSTADDRSACCEPAGIAPDQTFALSFPVGDDAPALQGVEVTYDQTIWTSESIPDSVTATLADPAFAPGRRSVAVSVHDGGAAAPLVIVQAVIRGPSGRLLDVASEQVTCLGPGERRAVRLDVDEPVPAGAGVSQVDVLPVRTGSMPDCSL